MHVDFANSEKEPGPGLIVILFPGDPSAPVGHCMIAEFVLPAIFSSAQATLPQGFYMCLPTASVVGLVRIVLMFFHDAPLMFRVEELT